ncbi:AAA domain-containing protein [Streptomyces gardneri]|uniref:AAA domain-containing protein n=1 Tax=Streptomyces gardneri TaxID=66892 RepID=UPI003699A232
MSDPAVVPEDVARVRQIFRYLAEVGESRTKPVRHHDGARHLLWFEDLPGQFATFLDESISIPGDRPLWLSAERPLRLVPPVAPSPLAHWLDRSELRDSERDSAPELKASAELPTSIVSAEGATQSAHVTVTLAEFHRRAEVLDQYRSWSAQWSRWAEHDRAVKPAVLVYDRLYRIHEDVSDLGESFELVVGLGYLTWRSGDERVRRHLVTCRAVIALDAESGTITVGPDPEHGTPTLEESMLDADQKARAHTRELVLQDLEGAGDTTDAETRELLHRALKTWAIAAHEAGRYSPSERRPGSTADASVPVVTFAPALLLRERTRRSMLEALRGVAHRIEQGAAPTQLLRVIAGAGGAPRPDDGDGAGEGTRGNTSPQQELYFALPSNDEQRTIAERLRDRDLVVVQGPPGTGKTHTIANLVTDLLAHGQRVLITSHTSRALKVLREKLPQSVRELCVSRTDDLTAQQELELSIKAILDRQGDFSPRDYQRRIKSHEEKLRAARSTQASALKTLRALREQETYRHAADIGDYEGTLAQIARRLHGERSDHEWIGAVPGSEPTLGVDAVTALRQAALAFTARHRALAASVVAELPPSAQLLSGSDFAQAVATVTASEADLDALRAVPETSRFDESVSALSVAQQDRLGQALDAFGAASAATAQETTPWIAALRDDATAGREYELRDQLERGRTALDEAEAAAAAWGNSLVSGLDGRDVPGALGLATTLRDGLSAGEKLRGPMGLKTRLRKAVGDFPEKVLVDGRPQQTAQAAEIVLQRIRLERHLQEIEQERGAVAAWQPPARRLARLRQDVTALTALAAVVDCRQRVVTEAAGAPELAGVAWQDEPSRAAVRALLRAHAARRQAAQPRFDLKETADTLRAAAHRRGAPAAVERASLAAEGRDPKAYAAAVGEIDELREALARKRTCDLAYTAVAEHLPDLADQLEADAESSAWDTRLPRFEAAWAWSAWSAKMTELTDPAAEVREMERLTQADADIRISLERLAADKAWFGCLARLTDDQAVALTSYQQNVRRLGKGTGKYAPMYRRQARESLRASQSAVPAWIMPLHQVTDTVPMDRAGRFDVVIIDEASQSGPEALLLAWLGAKIVVVGDDKQVSPANVGIDQEELFALQRRVLSGLPDFRRNLFAPTASFFDIASGLAGGRGRLMLREHFRCMPEIIGFSNELCYGGLLQPLRQYGADRLPPLRSVHVVDGYVEGAGQKQVNRPEAEQLVEAVARCVEDDAYAGRTMGVITLLGAAQRFLIEDLLADRIPLDERQRRRLRVGNAEEFQGDERDVVFISTVASLTGTDGPRRIGAFSSTLYQQHINVAASRARDQVWLFHSVTLTELAESDLRRRYLDWFSRPAEAQDGAGLGSVSPDEPHDAFDSLFEQRVFLALRGRGYRVRPQYPAGRYRIDLVVEGGTRRLAVECDGDAYHTEENADADAARQRELERVGWTFVRIRGSRYFLDPERALEPLWAELDRLGIETAAREEAATADAAVRDGELAESAPAVVATEPAPVRIPGPAVEAVPGPAPAPVSARGEVSGPDPVPAAPGRGRGAEPRTGQTKAAATWTLDPAGFRTVAWLRRAEVNAAQHAFSMRRSVPNDEDPAGSARFLPGADPSGMDLVEVVREGEGLVRVTHDEIQSVIRAGLAKTDVPVLKGEHQVALVRYHDLRSAEAMRHRSSTELLRRSARGPESETRESGLQATREESPPQRQPSPPRIGRQRRESRNKVGRLSVTAYRRVQRELDRIRDELEQPVPEMIAVDTASWRAQQADREQLHKTLLDRKDFLRTVLDEVEVDSTSDGGGLVTPGCLVGVEDPEEDGIVTYEIALRPGEEAEKLSPYTAMGEALLWREVGDTVHWKTEDGRRNSVIVRFVDG